MTPIEKQKQEQFAKECAEEYERIFGEPWPEHRDLEKAITHMLQTKKGFWNKLKALIKGDY